MAAGGDADARRSLARARGPAHGEVPVRRSPTGSRSARRRRPTGSSSGCGRSRRFDFDTRLVKAPEDIEAANEHMIRGTFHGGNRTYPQSGALRPAPGWASHRMPIEGLYQTGGTTHPGGSITGAPGRNAAMVLLQDLGLDLGGGGARWRTRACSRPLATGRRASCRRGWTTATSCASSASVERWEDWLDAFAALGDRHAQRAEEAEHADRRVTAGEAWLHAAVAYHFAKFVWVVDADARRGRSPTAPWPRSTPRITTSTRRRSGSRRRSTAAAIVGNLRVPWYDERPAAGPADPRPRFDQGGVLAARERLPGARDGGAVARRARARARAATRCRSATTTRSRRRRCSTRWTGAFDRVGALGVSLGGYYAPRAATFEPRIKAVAGISGAFNFGALWESLPELTRETFANKSGAADDDDARERALKLDLDGVLEQLEAPALFVTGRRDRLIPWESTLSARPTPRRAASSWCSRRATTCARTSPTSPARWSPTGCARTSGERSSSRSSAAPAATSTTSTGPGSCGRRSCAARSRTRACSASTGR